MKGLLLKDLLNLKQTMRIWLIMLALFIVMSVLQNDLLTMGSFLTASMMVLTVTAMAYDENSKWDRYALTMPVSQRDMVLEKYVLSTLITAAGTLCVLVLGILMDPTQIGAAAAHAVLMMDVTLLATALLLPVMFKYGVVKGRMMLMVFFLVPVVCVLLLNAADSGSAWMAGAVGALEWLQRAVYDIWPLLTVAVAASAVSFAVSLKVYKQKAY